MKLNTLKNFFNPNWEKLILLLVIDFFFTFILLLASDSMGPWAYLLSPNSLYLESTLDIATSTLPSIAFHGSVSNLIDLVYLYFLACLIVEIYKRVRGK
jgi:hypothetical protein